MRWLKKRSPDRIGDHETLFEVSGMTCGSCVARVEGILVGQEGVDTAKVDLAAGRARVTLTPAASVDSIVAAVTEAGYKISPLS